MPLARVLSKQHPSARPLVALQAINGRNRRGMQLPVRLPAERTACMRALLQWFEFCVSHGDVNRPDMVTAR